MGTSDDSFRATDSGLFGFLAESDDNNVPQKDFGAVAYALNVGVLGFSGVAADPEGPIQQNSYSGRAGVEGGSVAFTGTAGVSLNRVGVYGQVEDSPPVPAGFRAGVLKSQPAMAPVPTRLSCCEPRRSCGCARRRCAPTCARR